MSIKNNEIPKKLKEEILSQLKQEQEKFMQNVERKMEEHNNALHESIKKLEENKGFVEKILSNKYYFEKIESLDKISSKLNDGILAHEIRISKNIDDINALRTKYDKIIIDNLLLPGQIGPSCQFKNLSQYIKNNIYDMTRMKADNEIIKNIGNELKMKHENNTKNITDLINNSVTRSNQYTDSRLNDCIFVLENKLKEMNEKLMEMRMKSIQSQEKLQEDMENFKQNFNELIKIQDNKILTFSNMVEALNLRLPEEEDILNNIKKLKSKYHHIKEFLLEFIDTYEQNPNNNNINNNNNNNIILPQQLRHRQSSIILSSQLEGLSDNNLDQISSIPRKDQKLYSRIEDSVVNKEKINGLFSPQKHQRQSMNMNFKYKSNQKANIKLKLLNISENSSDDNDDKDDKDENKKEKNANIKKSLNYNNEKTNNNYSNDPKKNMNKSYRNNKLDKESRNKNNIKTKNNKNESKTLKKENSNFNSFESISGTSDNNYSKEKDKMMDLKSKKKYYNNKKNNERIMIQSKTISHQDKNIYNSNNNSKLTNNSNFLNTLIDNYNNQNQNNLPINRFKNTFQSSSRNYNNQISNNQNMNLNSKPPNFYRTQQEEKKEIIRDFFSKYDKSTIQNNLSYIKNRGNLDLYNYSVSPPDKEHFLDTKYDEIYDPPISKELIFNKKNEKPNAKTKISRLSKMKYNIKLNSENNFEPNNKKTGTMYNISNLGTNKFMNNKKAEYSNKFTNTFRGSLPNFQKKEKIYSMNSSKKK